MRARSLQDAFCELQDLAFLCCRCDDARAPRGRLRLPWPTWWALQDLARFKGSLALFVGPVSLRFLRSRASSGIARKMQVARAFPLFVCCCFDCAARKLQSDLLQCKQTKTAATNHPAHPAPLDPLPRHSPDKISASAFPENTYQHYLILPLFLIIVCPPTSD